MVNLFNIARRNVRVANSNAVFVSYLGDPTFFLLTVQIFLFP